MANGTVGRPKATDLTERCAGQNRAGARCGNAPLSGETVCSQHLGKVDPAKLATMVERLRAGADEAVARLRKVVKDGADTDAVRAAEILLSRVAPKLSSQHAIIVNVPGGPTDNVTMSAADIIRTRLEALRKSLPEGETPYAAEDFMTRDARIAEEDREAWATAPEPDASEPEDEIIQAELVEPAPQPQPVKPSEPQPYGVPRVSRPQPVDLQRMARERLW